MSLAVKRKNYKFRGYTPIFLLHVIPLLVTFALVLAIILKIGGKFSTNAFLQNYKSLSPFTVFIPFIIALSTALSYRRVLVTITPASKVDVSRVKEYFYRIGYMDDNRGQKEGVKPPLFTFKRTDFLRKKLCLNLDRPCIEIGESEIKVIMLRRLANAFVYQLNLSNKYEISTTDNTGNE